MPSTVYTQRFAVGQMPSTMAVVSLFTVPAGYTYVVRDMEFSGHGATSWGATLFISGTNAQWGRFVQSGIPSVQWEGRVVLLAGESLNGAATTSAGCDYVICGYAFPAS